MKKQEIKENIQKQLIKEGYKDYLTSYEEFEIVKILRLADLLEDFTQFLKDKNNIMSVEKKAFNTSITLIRKGINSIINRIDKEFFNRLYKKAENLKVVAFDEVGQQQLKKDIENTLKMEHEIKENYLNLVCEVMALNCQGCKKHYNSCSLYKEFIKNEVIEPDQEHYRGKKCKYGYRLQIKEE